MNGLQPSNPIVRLRIRSGRGKIMKLGHEYYHGFVGLRTFMAALFLCVVLISTNRPVQGSNDKLMQTQLHA